MTRIVGIDPSLAATGVASIGSRVDIDTFATKPTGETFDDRDQRMQLISDMVACYVLLDRRADLVVIEGPALGKASPHTWDRAGLWWRIVHRLRGVPVAVCPPTVRAKWATGKGNAGKAAVVASVARMWPDVPLEDDNAADALALATMGAQRLGMATPSLLARHADALNAVAWPELIPAEEAS